MCSLTLALYAKGSYEFFRAPGGSALGAPEIPAGFYIGVRDCRSFFATDSGYLSLALDADER